MHNELDKILLTEADIKKRITELGAQISRDYKTSGVDEIMLIAIINGAIIFTADLMRNIDLNIRLECIRVRSYGNKKKPDAEPEIVDGARLDIEGRHVLLIDDIIDTGRTCSKIIEILKGRGAASVKACMLLDKPERREVSVFVDYKGFTIPDAFVVGYGLDYAEKYRNLPYVAVLRSE
jgi:hypoxanthine phosphoribosyltransferase